jgi:hypothetical protein
LIRERKPVRVCTTRVVVRRDAIASRRTAATLDPARDDVDAAFARTDGQTVCLENRQQIAACEQIFSNDRSARGRPWLKAFGNQRLIRLARIVLRLATAQHRSGDRFRLACHAL